ncbi:uncharacterized protein LOC115541679 isoform X2 [Gadus morhua]|uniref:uncharacterized protein LOC115541679 isoform X2 n=1 Tax=Gadus morhua TaxID=8049 RepID=UPI0011B5027F|nr:uncharacterized protein LOC115541679 isoform X2 [Gadus morhua]
MGVRKVSNVFTPQRIITMKWMYIFLRVILGAVVSFQNVLSNPVLELIVRPGENVTLYCDCNSSTGVYIIWFRNCSHENQPTFVLETVEANPKTEIHYSYERKYLHYNFKWNISTSSHDLLINSISETHLGLYYCGTREKLTLDTGLIKFVYTYGNSTTRILLGPAAPDCGQCWMLLVILCPSSALLLSLLSSLVVYLLCRRKDEDLHVAQTSPSIRDVTSIRNQDEVGLCYATLDIPLRSQRPKKKRVQPSEFSTYSAINTKRM